MLEGYVIFAGIYEIQAYVRTVHVILQPEEH